jgi:hypothetical protein
MKMSFGRKTMLGSIGMIVAIGIGLMVLAAAGIAGWEYTNSDQFTLRRSSRTRPRPTPGSTASSATWAAIRP